MWSAVLLGPTDKIKKASLYKAYKRIASIMVGEGMLGRVIDPLGAPLDGKGLIGGELYEKCRWNARRRELSSVSR